MLQQNHHSEQEAACLLAAMVTAAPNAVIHDTYQLYTNAIDLITVRNDVQTRQFDCPVSNGMAALSCDDTMLQSLAHAHCSSAML